MTRHEAIAKVRGSAPNPYCDTASTLVDGLVALGILKLGEPKEAWEKFKDILCNEFDFEPSDDIDRANLRKMKRALDKAGLKIVEK